MALRNVSLDDKYVAETGQVFMTGVQALVRLPMLQQRRDERAGLTTGTFISGYRGSPLGLVDQQLWQAKQFLQKHRVEFQPGVNEELAATAVWGSQQTNLFGDGEIDGVVGMWYGKGPGVDRCGDVFKHGNNSGTSPHGGVVVLLGDDHAGKSSTLPHQSEFAMMDASIPVLNPSDVQEVIDFGLYAIAMSRFTGLWVSMKCVTEAMDSSATIDIDPDKLTFTNPDFEMPEGGLNIRWPDMWYDQEPRLQNFKLKAAHAFAHRNKIGEIVIDSPQPRFGIIATGKAYLDVRQALDDLGIDDALAAEIGLRVYKVGMSWPLEPQGAWSFAEGLDEVLVIEEKRGVIEPQLKEQFYNRPAASRPRVLGKVDPDGQALMSVVTELSPGEIAKAIMTRFGHYIDQPSVAARLAIIESKSQLLKPAATDFNRQPWFCSGCPHNTSTRVPEGSRATAGIGCHFMSVWMDRETHTYTHMGGEGIPWVGQSRFVKTKHIFANLGDGTYNHSGSMAIRMAVASGANITYKILYNDAVAMTGGQPADNGFTVPQIAAQVSAEGVKRVVVVADDPEKYPMGTAWPSGLQVEHRDDLDRVQRDLRDQEGVTVLIYDQTCATEKRRRRKRGLMEDPNKRIFINPLVCEGCGDCGTKSNCVSVTPVETDFGRKRRIDQSSCNKDYSCVKGFCPSFVNVIGGGLKRRTGEAKTADLPAVFEALPEPVLPAADDAYSIMVAGIGGTGVVTIGALLGMAANLEGRNATILDATGLAQKGGPVVSHVRIANARKDLHAVRVSSGNAKLLIACDIVTATQPDVLAKLSSDQSFAIVNTQETMNGYFAMNADMKFPGDPMQEAIRAAAGDNSSHFLAATQIATKLLGDSIAANGFMLGYAYQQGLIPVSAEAIERAMELNGVAIEFNKQAFLWGRRAAHDLAAVERIATPAEKAAPAATQVDDLDSMIASRREFLTAYQNQAYAGRYEALVRKVAAAEQAKLPGSDSLAKAVARYAFKLMAYKDEYEVARLHSSATFRDQLAEQFEGDYKLQFNLAPPLFSKRDPETGHLKKATFGPWMMTVFGILARFKGLRGTAFDIFGKTEERRTERALITDYFATVEMILERLSGDNHSLAVDLASVPERIRGYGHVKERHLAEALRREGELKAAFVSAGDKKAAAE